MNQRHLDAAMIVAFVDEVMADDARQDAARHLTICAVCRDEVDAGRRTRRLLRMRTAAALAAERPIDFTPRNRRLGQPSLAGRSLLLVSAGATALLVAVLLRPARIEATGVIGDSACGLKHRDSYAGDQRACTLNCVRRGAEFVLIVGEQMYQIKNQAFDNLAAFANARVTITGTVANDTITVSTITADTTSRSGMAEWHGHEHRSPAVESQFAALVGW